MTRRKSKREIETMIDALETTAGDLGDAGSCNDCGGMPEGYDAAEGVTAPFVTYECTCGQDTDHYQGPL